MGSYDAPSFQVCNDNEVHSPPFPVIISINILPHSSNPSRQKTQQSVCLYNESSMKYIQKVLDEYDKTLAK